MDGMDNKWARHGQTISQTKTSTCSVNPHVLVGNVVWHLLCQELHAACQHFWHSGPEIFKNVVASGWGLRPR